MDLRIARLQHQIILRWREGQRRPGTGVLRERWGVSKQVVSRTAPGQRWMGERLLAAMITELQTPAAASASRPQPSSSHTDDHGSDPSRPRR